MSSPPTASCTRVGTRSRSTYPRETRSSSRRSMVVLFTYPESATTSRRAFASISRGDPAACASKRSGLSVVREVFSAMMEERPCDREREIPRANLIVFDRGRTLFHDATSPRRELLRLALHPHRAERSYSRIEEIEIERSAKLHVACELDCSEAMIESFFGTSLIE